MVELQKDHKRRNDLDGEMRQASLEIKQLQEDTENLKDDIKNEFDGIRHLIKRRSNTAI